MRKILLVLLILILSCELPTKEDKKEDYWVPASFSDTFYVYKLLDHEYEFHFRSDELTVSSISDIINVVGYPTSLKVGTTLFKFKVEQKVLQSGYDKWYLRFTPFAVSIDPDKLWDLEGIEKDKIEALEFFTSQVLIEIYDGEVVIGEKYKDYYEWGLAYNQSLANVYYSGLIRLEPLTVEQFKWYLLEIGLEDTDNRITNHVMGDFLNGLNGVVDLTGEWMSDKLIHPGISGNNGFNNGLMRTDDDSSRINLIDYKEYYSDFIPSRFENPRHQMGSSLFWWIKIERPYFSNNGIESPIEVGLWYGVGSLYYMMSNLNFLIGLL